MKKVIKISMKIVWSYTKREYNKGRLPAFEVMLVNNSIKNIFEKLNIK